MNLKLFLLGVTIILSCITQAQDTLPIFEKSEKALEVARAKANQPLVDLMNKYEQALNNLYKQQQAKGDLDNMLVIKKELKIFRENTASLDTSAPAVINKLRNIYLTEHKKASATVKEAEIKALQHHIKSLNGTVTELAKLGNLKGAVLVREKIKALEKEIAESSKVEPEATDPNRVILVGPGASNEYTKKGIQEVQVTETKEGIQLTSGGNNTHIATNESFEVPFKIATSVMTNSVDIRIHFGAHGAMVFNSKERPGQLWMHHPETSEKTNANRGTGKLKVDEMHDIEILVRYNEIEILIDGKAKGLFKGNFLDVKGPVGIGPAHMAKVTVKSFYAEPLEE